MNYDLPFNLYFWGFNMFDAKFSFIVVGSRNIIIWRGEGGDRAKTWLLICKIYCEINLYNLIYFYVLQKESPPVKNT